MEHTEHRADYYTRSGDSYDCVLCPHRCRISKGRYGICGVRYGGADGLISKGYGRVSALCVDPIEKKPLYHYHPGSEILSVGGIGCNMTCKHCQNHQISQVPLERARTQYIDPSELTGICRNEGLDSIAFTYNEPSVWFEYMTDTMDADPDIRYVLVTNGLISKGPLEELCKRTDAMNIDVKGFTEGFYKDVCGARLSDVMDSVTTAFDSGVHIELTYLIIPGFNDSEEELNSFSIWVHDELSPSVPVHLTRFHPDYMLMSIPPTPLNTMVKAKETVCASGLEYVYLGNTSINGSNDTICPKCGSKAIIRNGYDTDICGVDGCKCSSCGYTILRE